MSPTPTGQIDIVDGAPVMVMERTFRAPIEDVWASVTESERLGRWIGTWTGDPASGSVEFLMTAEDSAEPETMQIRECEAPRSLKVTSVSEHGTWLLDVALTETAGVTTMTFAHPGLPDGEADNVGPGWEYYLDRWVVAFEGGEASSVAWDDYYPAMQEHYRTAWTAAKARLLAG